MPTNKHYIKILLSDDEEGCLICYDDKDVEVASTIDDIHKKIGENIHGEIVANLHQSFEAIYGYRINYTLIPIKKDPFK